jgi:sulfatase modifying factor 1
MKLGPLLTFLAPMLLNQAVAHAIFIDTVSVGNPGNAPDNGLQEVAGNVAYVYRIGKYEVTNAQYTEFLNFVDPTGANQLELYTINMENDPLGGINFNGGAADGSKYLVKPGRANNPVVHVSWYDALRFANWLHNGQGSGDTESGAYTLLGHTPIPSNAPIILRNPGAAWFLPSDNEWYKAAYHKNNGIGSEYWDFATASDDIPYSDQPMGASSPDPSNTANFFRDDRLPNGYNDGYAVTGSRIPESSQNYLTDVGAYSQSPSPYGTYDQSGNVWEWTDTLTLGPLLPNRPTLRGGAWSNNESRMRAQWGGDGEHPTFADGSAGFRVATVIPEPDALFLACLASVALLGREQGTRNSKTPCA